MQMPSNIKMIIVGFCGAIAGMVFLYFLFTHTIVTVSVQTPSQEKIALTVRSVSDKKTSEHNLEFGQQKRLLLKKGTYALSATQGRNQTTTSLLAKPFQLGETTVVIKNEAGAHRQASESRGCGTIFGSNYYSYSCQGETKVFKHTGINGTQLATTNELATSNTYRDIINTDGGLIGIEDDLEGGIEVQYYKLPSESVVVVATDYIKAGTDTSGFILVKNSSPQQQYEFALVDVKTGSWYLYKNPTDTQPKKISVQAVVAGVNDDLSNISNQLQNNRLISLYSTVTHKTEDSDGADEETPQRSSVVVTSSNGQLLYTINLPDNNKLEAAWMVNPTTLATKSVDDEVIAYDVTNTNKPVKVAGYDKMTSISSYGSSTLIGNDHEIFQMSQDGTSLRRVFESEHLNLSTIVEDKQGIRFTAFTNLSGGTYTSPDAYTLNLSEKPVYPRDQWHLPYQNETVRSLDYNDATIQVQLALDSYYSDRETGQVGYEQAEFNERAAEVSRELQQLGVVRNRTIIYTY